MSDKIQKYYKDLEPVEQKRIDSYILHELDMLFSIGDYLISNRDGSAYKITNIEFIQTKRRSKSDSDKFEMVDELRVYYGSSYIDEHDIKNYAVWKGSIEELQSSANDLMINGQAKEPPKENTGNDLMNFDKDAFVTLKEGLILKSQSMKAKARFAEGLLRQKVWQLEEILAPMLKEVKRLKTIIWTIELYLGIKENIVQIQKGEEADLDEPINLMQERLYMDEEVGDPENQGLDYNNIDDFYDWLLSFSKHFNCPYYELILPYKKCVRIMRVRRKEKNYNCPFVNMRMNALNFETVILIRNGENIYTIETDMRFGERLFPSETELMDLQNKIIKENKNVISRNGRKMDDEYREEILNEKMTTETDRYKRNFIIMQGLIDRTEVFGKLFGVVNLMDGSAMNKGQIVFNYDCDTSKVIGTGDKTFIEKMNESIKLVGAGSRVIQLFPYNQKYPQHDFFKMPWRRHDGAYPRYPKSGEVYNLLQDKGDDTIYFMYLPDEEIWSEELGYHPRKNRVAFAPSITPEWTADVDFFSHRDIDYLERMMYDRRQRRHYLSYMTILKLLIKFKKQELEEEKPFAQLIMSRCEVTELEALDAIFWWKTKNKYKRSIKVDDAKALRMIQKHLKNG